MSRSYFLNEKVKPTIHNGEEYFPLYCRIIFNRKNNTFPILDMIGDNIYFTKQGYRVYFEKLTIPPYYGATAVFLNKVSVLEKSFVVEQNKLSDKFELRKFVNKFRFYEKYLSLEFDKSLRLELLKIIKPFVLPNKYNHLVQVKTFPYLYSDIKNNNSYSIIKEPLIDKLDETFKSKIPALVALFFVLGIVWQQGEHNPEIRTRGTFFEWLHEKGKENFIKSVDARFSNVTRVSPIGNPIDLISNDFLPKKSDSEKYVQVIDNQLFMNFK